MNNDLNIYIIDASILVYPELAEGLSMTLKEVSSFIMHNRSLKLKSKNENHSFILVKHVLLKPRAMKKLTKISLYAIASAREATTSVAQAKTWAAEVSSSATPCTHRKPKYHIVALERSLPLPKQLLPLLKHLLPQPGQTLR